MLNFIKTHASNVVSYLWSSSSKNARTLIVGPSDTGKTATANGVTCAFQKGSVVEDRGGILDGQPRRYPAKTDADSEANNVIVLNTPGLARMTVIDTRGDLIHDEPKHDSAGLPLPTKLHTLVDQGVDFLVMALSPKHLGDPVGERMLSLANYVIAKNPDAVISFALTESDSYSRQIAPGETSILGPPAAREALAALAASEGSDETWKRFVDAAAGSRQSGSPSSLARRVVLEKTRTFWQRLALLSLRHRHVSAYFVAALPADEVGTTGPRSRESEACLGITQLVDDYREHWSRTHSQPRLRPWMLSTAGGLALAVLGAGMLRRSEARDILNFDHSRGGVHKDDHGPFVSAKLDLERMQKEGAGAPPRWVSHDVPGEALVLKRVNDAYSGLVAYLRGQSKGRETALAESTHAILRELGRREAQLMKSIEPDTGSLLPREQALLDKSKGDRVLLDLVARYRDDLRQLVAVMSSVAACHERPSADSFEAVRGRLAETEKRLASRRYVVVNPQGGLDDREFWKELLDGVIRPHLKRLIDQHPTAYSGFLRGRDRSATEPLPQLADVTADPYWFLASQTPTSPSTAPPLGIISSLEPRDVIFLLEKDGLNFEVDLLRRVVSERRSDGTLRTLSEDEITQLSLSRAIKEGRRIDARKMPRLVGFWVRPDRLVSSIFVRIRRQGSTESPPWPIGLAALGRKLEVADGRKNGEPPEVALALEGWPAKVDRDVIEMIVSTINAIQPAFSTALDNTNDGPPRDPVAAK